MSKIINLFGGPGSGKSTTAAGVFHLMKLHGHSVELVTEFAKRLVWEDRTNTLAHQQAYVHAKQLHYLSNVIGKVDYIITDSPTILSAIYAPSDYPPSFQDFVYSIFCRYYNINFMLRRTKGYKTEGRLQSEMQARLIDAKIRDHLDQWHVSYIDVPGDKDAPAYIIGQLERGL